MKQKQEKKHQRVNASDLSCCITRPKNAEERPAVDSVVRYNVNGESDESKKTKLSDDKACATKITVGKNTIYKIKTKRGGKLFNPLLSGYGYGLDVPDKTSNRQMFQYREVNQRAFENYIKFLESKYDSYLLAAEREA